MNPPMFPAPHESDGKQTDGEKNGDGLNAGFSSHSKGYYVVDSFLFSSIHIDLLITKNRIIPACQYQIWLLGRSIMLPWVKITAQHGYEIQTQGANPWFIKPNVFLTVARAHKPTRVTQKKGNCLLIDISCLWAASSECPFVSAVVAIVAASAKRLGSRPGVTRKT